MPLKLKSVFGHGPKSKRNYTFLLYTTARNSCKLELEVKLSFYTYGTWGNKIELLCYAFDIFTKVKTTLLYYQT